MSWKKPTLIGAWSFAALAWLVQIPVVLMVSEKKTLLLLLGGAAAITELTIYATAALLGMTLVESRRKIWNTMKAVMTQRAPKRPSIK